MTKLFPLINQDFNRQLLLNAINNERIANAYLFYGPEGSGHEGFALELAAMLNCTHPAERPCTQCASCHKTRTLEHANLQMVFPLPIRNVSGSDSDPFKGFSQSEMEEIQAQIQQKAINPYEKISIPNAKHISISLVRDVKRKIYLTAQEPGWKVTVFFDAHLMTEEAANAFLKILEEPPPKSTFILTTSRADTLIPTIRSRCQPVFFPPLPQFDVERRLQEQGVPSDQIKLIVGLAGGDIGKALRLAQAELDELKQLTLEILRSIAVWNVEKIYGFTDTLASLYRQDPERFRQVMQSVSFWFRDAMILKFSADEDHLIHRDLKTEIGKFVKAFPLFDGFELYSAVENCIDLAEHNVYINLALQNMFFQMYSLIKPKKKSS